MSKNTSNLARSQTGIPGAKSPLTVDSLKDCGHSTKPYASFLSLNFSTQAIAHTHHRGGIRNRHLGLVTGIVQEDAPGQPLSHIQSLLQSRLDIDLSSDTEAFFLERFTYLIVAPAQVARPGAPSEWSVFYSTIVMSHFYHRF